MAIPVKRKVKVLKAAYVEEAEAVLVLGECQEGRFRQQIPAAPLLRGVFGDSYMDIPEEIRVEGMKTFAAELEKRTEPFLMVFDTELEGKIKDHYPLKY